MRKIKFSRAKITKLLGLFGALTLAIAIPVTLVNTVRFSEVYQPLLRQAEISYYNDNTEYGKFKQVNYSFEKLIKGDRNYNGGNYVIYLGTEACDSCQQFLYGNHRDNFVYDGQMRWNNSPFMSALSIFDTSTYGNVKFLLFEDIFPRNQETTAYDRLPWATWQTTDLAKNQIAGQFVRNDQSAVTFRKIFNYTQLLYPEVAGTPSVLAFKGGVMHYFNPVATATNNEGSNTDTTEQALTFTNSRTKIGVDVSNQQANNSKFRDWLKVNQMSETVKTSTSSSVVSFNRFTGPLLSFLKLTYPAQS